MSQHDSHHRRSIRLQGYDYTQAGVYFVTICTFGRTGWFCEIVDDVMQLSAYGRIVNDCWDQICVHFPDCDLDEFVVMPNHVHGIVIMTNCKAGGENAGRSMLRPYKTPVTHMGYKTPVAQNVLPVSLAAVVRSFKSAVTKQVNALDGGPGSPIWQRNYYEHVVRNEDDLNRIRQYIVENPLKWALDEENPAVNDHG